MGEEKYSRAFTYLVFLAVLVFLGAFVIFANTATTGYATRDGVKDYKQATTDISDYNCCRGVCYQGYNEGNEKGLKVSCDFGGVLERGCACEPGKIPAEGEEVGTLGCNVQYYQCANN